MLKRLLKKFCWNKKIDKLVYYHDMFMKVKGKVYKNKCVLMESMHKSSRERKFSGSEMRLALVTIKSCFIKICSVFIFVFFVSLGDYILVISQEPEGEKTASAPQ